MGMATMLKKPVWLFVTPPLARSMSGLTGWPRDFSRSPWRNISCGVGCANGLQCLDRKPAGISVSRIQITPRNAALDGSTSPQYTRAACHQSSVLLRYGCDAAGLFSLHSVPLLQESVFLHTNTVNVPLPASPPKACERRCCSSGG